MGIIGGVGLLIGGTIGGAVTAVTALVAGVVTAVTATVAAITASVLTAVSGIGVVMSNIIGGVSSLLPVNLISIETKLAFSTAVTSGNIFATVQTIGVMFQQFLTAIHFTTLKKIHDIAFLVSNEYRVMIRKVWGEIAKFAEAVELPAGYLETAINTARIVVMDVSGFLGRSYDLAEVTWLTDFKNLLGTIEDKASQYRKNPQIIWDDLNSLIIKPAIDNKARVQQNVFSTIESIIAFGEATIEDLGALKNRWTTDLDLLPFKWSADIKTRTDVLWGDLQSWRNEIYLPVINNISSLIDIMYIKQTENKAKLNSLFKDLSLPGDYLSIIDKLSHTQKMIQEDKINSVSQRAFNRDTKEWSESIEDTDSSFEMVTKIMEFKQPPSMLPYKEIQGLITPIGKQKHTQNTWYVGDY